MPYIVDGHNLIAAMPGLSLSDLDDERSLIQILSGYAQAARKSITVYFDRGSLAAPNLPGSARVKVRFIRLPRTADDAIRAHIKRLGGDAANWTVVTSDGEVRIAAREAGARVTDSATFASLLLNPAIEEGKDEKPETSLNQEDIEFWEQLFEADDRETSP